jgi:hypothetical protein
MCLKFFSLLTKIADFQPFLIDSKTQMIHVLPSINENKHGLSFNFKTALTFTNSIFSNLYNQPLMALQ